MRNGNAPAAAAAAAAFTQEIKDVFSIWTQAWNDGDLEGYLKAYAESEQTRYCSGSKVVRGKAAIANLYRQRGASGQLTVVEFEAQAVGALDGIVFGQFELVTDDDGATYTGAFTVHVQKINGAWRIMSDHSAA